MLRKLLAVVDRELRSQLRDSMVLLFAVLFPLLFIPGTLWVTMQALLLQDALSEAEPPRVAVQGDAALLGELLAPPVEVLSPADPKQALLDDELDLLLVVDPQGEALTLTLHELSTRDRSHQAVELIEERADVLRADRREALAGTLGVRADALRRWSIKTDNVDELPEMVSDLLATAALPLVMMMLAINAFYPAMELAVGEREGGCLETTLISAAPRELLLAGKLIAVVLLAALPVIGGALGVGLTLASLFAQIAAGADSGALALLAEADLQLAPAALALTAVHLAALLPFLIGAYTLCGLPARDLKEAQTVGTFMMLLLLAPLGWGATQPELTLGTAAVPVLNTLLHGQAALLGDPTEAGLVALSLGVNLGLAGLFLLIGARLMRSERFLLGDWLPRRVRALLAGRSS